MAGTSLLLDCNLREEEMVGISSLLLLSVKEARRLASAPPTLKIVRASSVRKVKNFILRSDEFMLEVSM